MKIILPHRTIVFKEEHKMLADAEKVALVKEILNEEVTIKNKTIKLEHYFQDNFNNRSVIVALDMLAYFITKEHKVKQDIMTRETIKKMQKGDGRTINFSNLNYTDNLKMGVIDDASDSNYN